MRVSATPLLTALAALALAGCAHERDTMTFAEAGILDADEPAEAPQPPAAEPAPERVAAEPAGPPIDGTLVRFSCEARVRRLGAEARRGFPLEALSAWDALSAEVDRYLARPLPSTPVAELSRAIVALEAELEWDRRRYGEAPEALSGTVDGLSRRLRARLEAVRATGSLAAAPAEPTLHWPVDGGAVSSPFGLRRHPIDHEWKMHWGLDVSARPGRVVGAAAAGWVVHAGWSRGYGLMVEVRHPGGLTTRYSHLARLTCSPGDPVETGQPLGLVGSTGNSTGPHLHFEVWREGRARDPLAMLGGASFGGGH